MTAMPDQGMSTARIESWLVIAVVFLAPINFLRLPGIFVTASDIVALCTLFVMAFRQRLRVQFFGPVTSFWVISLLLLQTGLMIASIVNGSPKDGIVGFAQYGFSLFLLPVLICNRPFDETLDLIKVFALSMVLIMCHGIYAAHVTPDDLRFMSYSGRLTSMVERENAAGTLVALALVFLSFLIYTRRIRIITFAVSVPILVYGLMLTASNTGFLLSGIGILVLAIFTGSGRLMIWVSIVAIAALTAIYQFGESFLPDVFVKRVMGMLISGDITEAGTFAGRMALIDEAMEIARETLFVGLGMDQYRQISAQQAPVHNTYLLLLAEGSILSLVGLVGLFLSGVFLSWRALQFPETRLIGGLTVTVVVMYAIAVNGFAHVYARFWAVPFLLVLSLSVSAVSARAERVNLARLRKEA